MFVVVSSNIQRQIREDYARKFHHIPGHGQNCCITGKKENWPKLVGCLRMTLFLQKNEMLEITVPKPVTAKGGFRCFHL